MIEAAAAACCAAVGGRGAGLAAVEERWDPVAVMAVPEVGVGSIDDDPPPSARSCARAAVLNTVREHQHEIDAMENLL